MNYDILLENSKKNFIISYRFKNKISVYVLMFLNANIFFQPYV